MIGHVSNPVVAEARITLVKCVVTRTCSLKIQKTTTSRSDQAENIKVKVKKSCQYEELLHLVVITNNHKPRFDIWGCVNMLIGPKVNCDD